MKTFYDLLNIKYEENKENVKLAYKNKIKIYKYKELNSDDILAIKQLKTAYYILTNDNLREIYNNFLFTDNDVEIEIEEVNAENDNLDVLFTNIMDNSEMNSKLKNIPNTKVKSIEKANNFFTERIFNNITPLNNKVMYNPIIPIQTREDRKLTN